MLDTETTGLHARLGDRVIEIGCIELLSRSVTERHFHRYVNPEREIDEGAAKVHGLTAEFLADKPKFADIAKEFVDYVSGAELIIHNAAFDVEFLDRELSLVGSEETFRILPPASSTRWRWRANCIRASATGWTPCASAMRSTTRTARCTARCSMRACWPRSTWRSRAGRRAW